jgi:tetratricopeptide (TPR) repeat protein
VNHDYNAALIYYSKAVSLNENDAFFFLLRGELQLEYLKEIELAIKDFKKSLELKPNYDDALYDLAYAYAKKENYPKSKENIEQTLKINSKHSRAINLLGEIFRIENKFNESINFYNEVLNQTDLDLNVEYDRKIASLSYSNRGYAYFELGKHNEAKSDLDKAILLDNKNPIFFVRKANFWEIQKNFKFDSVIFEISKAIELDPDNIEYLEFRGNLYDSLNNYPKAISDFRKIIQIDSNNTTALYMLGDLYLNSNLFDSAAYFFNEGINIVKDDELALSSFYSSRGDVKCAQGLVNEALNDYNLALSLDKDAFLFESRSLLFLDYIGDTLKALDDINSAKKISTSNESLFYEASATMNLKINDLKSSLSDINKAIDHFKKSNNFVLDYFLVLKAIILHKQGNKPDSEKILAEIETTDSSNLSIRICRAKLAIEDGDYATALKNLDLAEKDAPKDPEIYYYKGKCYEKMNKSLNAAFSYSKTISCIDGDFEILDLYNSEISKSEIYYQIGKFYEKNNEFDLMCQHYKISKNLIKEIHKINNKVIIQDIDNKLKIHCQN